MNWEALSQKLQIRQRVVSILKKVAIWTKLEIYFLCWRLLMFPTSKNPAISEFHPCIFSLLYSSHRYFCLVLWLSTPFDFKKLPNLFSSDLPLNSKLIFPDIYMTSLSGCLTLMCPKSNFWSLLYFSLAPRLPCFICCCAHFLHLFILPVAQD